MQEKDITDANVLYSTKRELRWSLGMAKGEDTIDIIVQNQAIPIRTGVFEEMIHKELAYVDRKLKSLGIKELS